MQYKLAQSIKLDKGQCKAVPLYEQIRHQISDSIQSSGRFRDGDQLPSISLLARELDVNYRTIKSAYDLLEKDGLIKNEPNKGAVVNRRDAVAAWTAAHDLAFSFISCCHGDGYFVAVAEGIRKFALEHNLDYSLVDVGNSPERFIEAMANPGSDRSGMLVLPLERPGYAEAIRQAVENDMKVVLIDRILPGIDVSSVESDHFTGAYLATNHLLKEHNRPVYYLGFVDKPSSCRDWVRGWSQAMFGYNFRDLDSYCFNIKAREEDLTDQADLGLEYDIEAAVRLFKEAKEDVYCIYAGNDFIARGVYIAAKKLGLQIGKDVFVVGYNDMPFAQSLTPPLSSIRQLPSIEQVGYEAAKLLYQHMLGIVGRPVRRLMPVELVIRESSTGKKDQGI